MSALCHFKIEMIQQKKYEDKLLKTYEDHQDSVYSIAWSCSDEGRDWATFASLSYDGQVVINQVPDEDAKRILTG